MSSVAEQVATVPVWWHSIDLGDGVVTPGSKSPEVHAWEVGSLALPDLRGKRVLDVGAWDGYYSFLAERLGAAEVVALDHYAWSMDLAAQQDYRDHCRRRGAPIQPYHEVLEVWRPDTLPGKRGFDVAHAALGSRVKAVVGDFMTMDLAPLGTFDVVLFLGVLYHLRDPLGGLTRLCSLTDELAVVETQAVAVKETYDHLALLQFFRGDELSDDPTNWFVPNRSGLVALLEAAGFARAEALSGAPELPSPPGQLPHYRATAHAWAR